MRIVADGNLGDRPHFVRRIEPHSTETTQIVEKFKGDHLGPAFEETSPGDYVYKEGAASYIQSQLIKGHEHRGYIRTVAADFWNRDFVFEATLDLRLSPVDNSLGYHQIFFGMGDGRPNAKFYDLVSCGVILDLIADKGKAFARFCHPDSYLSGTPTDLGRIIDEVVPPGGLKPGRHRFRMTKVGRSATFSVDADFNGEFRPDFTSRAIDLTAAGPPLLNATNCRLLIGVGNCDTMKVTIEELSITYSETSKKPSATSLRTDHPPAAGKIGATVGGIAPPRFRYIA